MCLFTVNLFIFMLIHFVMAAIDVKNVEKKIKNVKNVSKSKKFFLNVIKMLTSISQVLALCTSVRLYV